MSLESEKDAEDAKMIEFKKDSDSPDDIKKCKNAGLCGYLLNWSSQKLTKKPKQYWFVYSENSCKLYYFNNDRCSQPSGLIDISGATFSLEVENPNAPGLFRISTPNELIDLEAPDRKTALYWLQELQKHRRRYSRKRTANMKVYGISYSQTGSFDGGLLKDPISDDQLGIEDDIIPLAVDPNESRESASEEDTGNAPLRQAHSTSSNMFSSFRSFRNGIINIRPSRSSDASISSCEEPLTGATGPSSPIVSPQQVEQKIFSKASKGRSSFRSSLSFSFLSKESGGQSTPENACKRCAKANSEIQELRDTVVNLNDEVKSSREAISLLQQQLDLACRQKESLMKIHVNPNMECHMRLAIAKDVEFVHINNRVEELQKELDDVKLQYVALMKESKELRKHDEDIIQLKNEVIDQLTEQVAALEMERAQVKVDDNDPFVVILRHHPKDIVDDGENAYSEYDKLKDELQAYRIQNKFLNCELMQLNLLRRDSEERETLIKMKCIEWESKYYAIQSKYLVLLNEYHLPTNGLENSYSQEPASQLLHEAVSDTTGPDYMNIAKVISCDGQYDIYGFSKSSSSPSLSLLQSAYLLKQRSEEIEGRLKDSYADVWINKWDHFMACLGKRSIQPSPMLKELVRSGVPFVYRSKIWKRCIDLHIHHIRENKPKNYYEMLLALNKKANVLDMSGKQIELDLLRTLPHNKHFENAHADGIPKLRRVLLAFSRHNQEIGYCQGFNRLGAIALLFLQEEAAFWCLVAMVEVLMPSEYYTRDLIGAQVDQLVLKDLVAEKCPLLHAHLERHNMDISLFTFNWFMCMFVDCVPIETYLFIWDSILYEGNKVMFRFALAILKFCEETCFKAKDSIRISSALRHALETITDWKRLAQIAFNDLNPFPRRTISNKREHYLAIVKQEVEKINLQRATIRTPKCSPKLHLGVVAAGPSWEQRDKD